MEKLNPGAYNIRREFDGENTTFYFNTPVKNGVKKCKWTFIGEHVENNGVLSKITTKKQDL